MKFLKLYGKVALFFVALFVVGTISSSFLVARYFSAVGREETSLLETLVEIPFGSSLQRVSEILEQAHVVDSKRKFYWYVRLGRVDGSRIQAGFYNFSGKTQKSFVAERLLFGRDQSFKFTFKEGQTLVDLANGLAEMGLFTKEDFALAMQSKEILDLIRPPQNLKRELLENGVGGIEGYLFPDTYFFSKRDSASSVIKKMYAKLLAVLDGPIALRMREQNTSLHEVLTLASIVEKETGALGERPLIASVYQNRLRVGMRLQADPTVIYGIKDYNGKIRKADLLAFHPYNTYKITGLPPGPIAAPGQEAIRAVLWPEQTKYFYFVSKNDGSHIFCENLDCHNQAVRKWQIDFFRKQVGGR